MCIRDRVIIALFIAIPYGIVAVAIAQLFSVFMSFFINAYYPGKLFGFGAKAQLKQIFPIAIASLIMYSCIAIIKLDSIELQMITKIVVGGAIYILLCWAFKVTAFIDVVTIVLSRFKANKCI